MLVPAQSHFGRLFPFHLAVDRSLTIVQAGPTLIKLAGEGLLGAAFAERFAVERPAAFPLDAEALWEARGRLFIVRCHGEDVLLKGQWLEAEGDPDKLVFAAALSVAQSSDLTALALSLQDLELHNTTLEFMTALRTAQLALQDSKRQAEQLVEQSRLLDEKRLEAESANRAKSAFIATVSHEIRTPLNGILGLADLLLETELETQDRGMVKAIRMSGEVLRDLLNDILDLSKIESGKLAVECRDFNLRHMLDSVIVVWQTRIHAQGLRFTASQPDEVPPALRGDPLRIRQILANFLSNAAKFTAEGGIALRLAVEPRGADAVGLVFEVEDSGPGIKPEFIATLFDRFTQEDPSVSRRYGGSGLGLAICRELAELMEGEVEVESTVGRGSTFRLRVPCRIGDVSAIDPEERPKPAATADVTQIGRRLRVLVAEDNVLNQTVIRSMLLRVGHEVDVVANGCEAVDAVCSRPYDVVLMDVQMPVQDGIEATRRIRALEGAPAAIPIIAVTANAAVDDGAEMAAAGLNDYVVKPIESELLYAAIDRQVAATAGSTCAAESAARAPLPAEPMPLAEGRSALEGLLGSLEAID